MTPDTLNYDSSQYFFDLLSFCLLLLPCYYMLKAEAARRALLTLSGVYLVYFIAPRLVLFYFVFWLAAFLLQRAIAWAEKNGPLAAAVFTGSAACVLLPMLLWKMDGQGFSFYFNFYTSSALLSFSKKLWEIDLIRDPIAPVGLSFATFRALDMLIKTWLGRLGPLSFGRVMFYGFFPPVQVTGPIIEYEEVARQGAAAEPQAILEGAVRASAGALKVFFLAVLLKNTGQALETPHAFSMPRLWAMFIGYSWYFYINFSGYSDMAIGTARMFGFRLKENFDFPFFRRNLQEFWSAWHMSLTRWAQRNVFVPAGGYRPETQYIALYLTIMTIAMWHGCTLSMAVFGAYHFAGLAACRLYGARLKRAGKPAGDAALPTLCTYAYVLMSFPLITLPIGKALAFYAALAGR